MQWLIGDVKITSIAEQELGGLDMIIPGATTDVLERLDWLRPHFVNAEGIMTGLIQSFVIETPELRIVVDTCVGNDKDREAIEAWHRQQRPFLEKFAAAGYPPASIDVVLCTHMHFDHVGWNTSRDGDAWKPTFPNARYVFSENEFRYWEQELHRPPRVVAQVSSSEEMLHVVLDTMARQTHRDSVTPVVEAGLSELVTHDHQVCPEVRLTPTPGHTPGHVSVVITSRGQSAFLTGDLLHHPVQIAVPALGTVADVGSEGARRTRETILRTLAGGDTLLIGNHFSEPTAGYVRTAGDGFRLTQSQ